jgi:hypothetical protein
VDFGRAGAKDRDATVNRSRGTCYLQAITYDFGFGNSTATMNELQSLSALGLALPSPAYLVGMLLFSLIGYAAYRRGRSSARGVLTWTGVALMLYPYLVPQTWLLWLVGAAMCGWLYRKWN